MSATKVDQNGRVLLPAAIRRALGLKEGSELIVSLEPQGRVVLTSPVGAWTRLQALVPRPAPHSVVDELLAERREEARCDLAGDPVGPTDG